MRKFTFESKFEEINREILKRRSKWNLSSLRWIDFNDIAQILRIHIYNKWNLYDQSKPLAPWINRIVSNQIKNLIRNNYGNYSRPCLKCEAADGESGCLIYKTQCAECPIYKKWEKSKKGAFDTKLPLSLENHSREVGLMPKDSDVNFESSIKNVHEKMKSVLKPYEWKFYQLIYIEHRSEEEAAKSMGYRTSEKNRQIGYKQVKNIKKSILEKAKKYIYNGDIDII